MAGSVPGTAGDRCGPAAGSSAPDPAQGGKPCSMCASASQASNDARPTLSVALWPGRGELATLVSLAKASASPHPQLLKLMVGFRSSALGSCLGYSPAGSSPPPLSASGAPLKGQVLQIGSADGVRPPRFSCLTPSDLIIETDLSHGQVLPPTHTLQGRARRHGASWLPVPSCLTASWWPLYVTDFRWGRR